MRIINNFHLGYFLIPIKYYFGVYAISVGKYESGIVNLCHSKENTS